MLGSLLAAATVTLAVFSTVVFACFAFYLLFWLALRFARRARHGSRYHCSSS